MDLTQLLRSQARRYRCAACRENMADCAIDVLAHEGNRALVKVTCVACRDENLLQIIFQEDGDDSNHAIAAERPQLFDEPRPVISAPISADEMLDLHSLLEHVHGGGFRGLFPPES